MRFGFLQSRHVATNLQIYLKTQPGKRNVSSRNLTAPLSAEKQLIAVAVYSFPEFHHAM